MEPRISSSWQSGLRFVNCGSVTAKALRGWRLTRSARLNAVELLYLSSSLKISSAKLQYCFKTLSEASCNVKSILCKAPLKAELV